MFSVQNYLPLPHRRPTRTRDSKSPYVVVGSLTPLVLLGEFRTLWGEREQAIYTLRHNLNCYKAKVYQWSTVRSQTQGLSVYCLQKGTFTIAENAWCVIEWYTKQCRHFSYLSSYKTDCACIHTVGTYAPAD